MRENSQIKKKNRISIIVPVYKIEEPVLNNTIRKLVSQRGENLEIILVDDGSPDDCGLICDKWSRLDYRIKVIHTKNRGVSSARNTGIQVAKGDYLLFVDADDVLLPGVCELFSKIELDESDIIFFKNTEVKEEDLTSFNKSVEAETSIRLYRAPSNIKIAKCVIANNEALLGYEGFSFGSPWGKLFRRSFLIENTCIFPEGIKKTQDRIFIVRCLSRCPSLKMIDIVGYAYVKRSSSICNAYNPQIFNILNQAYECMRLDVLNDWSGEERDDLLSALPYLKYYFYISGIQLTFFQFGKNESAGNQSREFSDLSKQFRYIFKKCSCRNVTEPRFRIMLLLLKLGLYNLVYSVLCSYFSRKQLHED